jgi:hypothetical protein
VTRPSHIFRSLLIAISLLPGILFAATITGVVTNKTTNKPSAGDDVVLIRLAQTMEESTRTKTDAQGRFTLDLPDAGMHLVRVTHDKATYFGVAPPGTQSVDVDVYSAAAKVDGISEDADAMRIESGPDGKSLRVQENFFIKNDSKPPRTQFSDKPFEFYLPDGAVIESSGAKGPGSMSMMVRSDPVPLDSKGHFAFLFPIRPSPSPSTSAARSTEDGDTIFQVNYHLPYNGSLKLAPHPTMPTDNVIVMLPKSMTFKAGPSVGYASDTEITGAQAYVARNSMPSQPLDFTLSGDGQLPRDIGAAGQQDAQSGTSAGPSGPMQEATAGGDTRPGGGLGNPIDPDATHDPWAKYKWWVLGGLALALAAAAGVLVQRPIPAAVTVTASTEVTRPVQSQRELLLSTLKEELFALETERLEGKLTEESYAQQKAALETVLRRALARS